MNSIPAGSRYTTLPPFRSAQLHRVLGTVQPVADRMAPQLFSHPRGFWLANDGYAQRWDVSAGEVVETWCLQHGDPLAPDRTGAAWIVYDYDTYELHRWTPQENAVLFQHSETAGYAAMTAVVADRGSFVRVHLDRELSELWDVERAVCIEGLPSSAQTESERQQNPMVFRVSNDERSIALRDPAKLHGLLLGVLEHGVAHSFTKIALGEGEEETRGPWILRFSPDGTRLWVLLTLHGVLRCLDVQSGTMLCTITLPEREGGMVIDPVIAVTPSNECVVFSSVYLSLWNDHGDCVRQVAPFRRSEWVEGAASSAVLVAEDGTWLTITSTSGIVKMFDLPALTERTERAPQSLLQRLAWIDENTLVAVPRFVPTLPVWNVATGAVEKQLRTSESVLDVMELPLSAQLAALCFGDSSNHVRVELFDVRSDRKRVSLRCEFPAEWAWNTNAGLAVTTDEKTLFVMASCMNDDAVQVLCLFAVDLSSMRFRWRTEVPGDESLIAWRWCRRAKEALVLFADSRVFRINAASGEQEASAVLSAEYYDFDPNFTPLCGVEGNDGVLLTVAEERTNRSEVPTTCMLRIDKQSLAPLLLKDGNLPNGIEVAPAPFLELSVSADASIAVVGWGCGVVRVRPEDGEELEQWQFDEEFLTASAMTPSGKRLAVASCEGPIYVFDLLAPPAYLEEALDAMNAADERT